MFPVPAVPYRTAHVIHPGTLLTCAGTGTEQHHMYLLILSYGEMDRAKYIHPDASRFGHSPAPTILGLENPTCLIGGDEHTNSRLLHEGHR